MNVNKIIWYGSLTILSACLSVFLSKLAIIIPGLRVAYIIGILCTAWFFKSQWNEGFRQAIANLLNIDESEYIVIIFFILIGILIGVLPTWINTIL
ncbi:MAG: hypothetical protein F6K08_15905 [Okeania sp. SIO1H6]|nr:hypothetical protein [Okeania sp. SIO1H6]